MPRENDNAQVRWIAGALEGRLVNGTVTHATVTLKPQMWSNYRNFSQIDLIKDLETNQVTIILSASARAREEGVFGKISAVYKNNSQIKEEQLTAKINVKVPRLFITVPYDQVSKVLQTINEHEDNLYKMSQQTIKRLPETISESAVSHLIETFRKVFR